jgi:hypothetical protein
VKLAYADPPYPGRAHLYADHPDFAGEVDHAELVERLIGYDGWALSTSASALRAVLPICPAGVRVLAWVKHTVNVSWEPLIVKPARPVRDVRDWIEVEPDCYQWRPRPASYVIGQKPEPFCRWMFEWLGADHDDELDDLYPGSGAVGRAWARWSVQPRLGPPPSKRSLRREPTEALELS